MIDDKRTEQEKAETEGFVVATDSFMSGWGLARGTSYFAVPYRATDNPQAIFERLDDRPEMKRVRYAGKDYRPKLRENDHLSIRNIVEVIT